MAAKSHTSLFFDAFLAFNLDRYENDPAALAKFTGLTEQDVVITDITEISQPVDGSRRASVASSSRKFSGVEQDWTPADAEKTIKLYNLINDGAPLAGASALQEQTIPGVYSYTAGPDTLAGVVIGFDVPEGGEESAVQDVLIAALKYTPGAITVGAGQGFAVLAGDTFNGDVLWYRGTEAEFIIPPTFYGNLGDSL